MGEGCWPMRIFTARRLAAAGSVVWPRRRDAQEAVACPVTVRVGEEGSRQRRAALREQKFFSLVHERYLQAGQTRSWRADPCLICACAFPPRRRGKLSASSQWRM